jgi:hypothetical protein
VAEAGRAETCWGGRSASKQKERRKKKETRMKFLFFL